MGRYILKLYIYNTAYPSKKFQKIEPCTFLHRAPSIAMYSLCTYTLLIQIAFTTPLMIPATGQITQVMSHLMVKKLISR